MYTGKAYDVGVAVRAGELLTSPRIVYVPLEEVRELEFSSFAFVPTVQPVQPVLLSPRPRRGGEVNPINQEGFFP